MVSNVTIEGLTKRFGETVAVNNVDIEVEEGKLIALLGPSGCGKTTTLRSICGLEQIDEGRITIGDRTVASSEENIHVPPYKRNVGMMFQSNALWPHMNVKENILYPLKQKEGKVTGEDEERVAELLELVELPGMERRPVNELSGGQQQRVALARSLIHEPDVLLMDEPLSSLDARLQRAMRADLRALQQQYGYTTVYVTHDQQEAIYMADEIYLMRDGEIIESGTPEDIYHSPREPFSMEFLDPNDPIKGTVKEVNGTEVSVSIPGLAKLLKATTLNDVVTPGDQCHLYVRPTDVEIIPATESAKELRANGGGDDNIYDCKIELCAFQGSQYEVRFEIGEFSILGEIEQPVNVGDKVKVILDPSKVRCFPD